MASGLQGQGTALGEHPTNVAYDIWGPGSLGEGEVRGQLGELVSLGPARRYLGALHLAGMR